MHDDILDQMQALSRDEIKSFDGDFERIEQAVTAMVMSFGTDLLQRVVDSARNGYQGSSIACECGRSMRFVQHRARDIHTLFGWIRPRAHQPGFG